MKTVKCTRPVSVVSSCWRKCIIIFQTSTIDFENEIINIYDYKKSFDNKRNNFLENFVRPIDINIEVGEIVRTKNENLLSKAKENN